MGDLLEVRDLSKEIASKRILSQVSFAAQSGDLLLITGPNGAGKTTLLRLICGLSKQSSGQILWNGKKLGKEAKPLGYISHRPMLYSSLSVLENMTFFGKLNRSYSPARLESLLAQTDLWLYRNEPVGVLSRGMQQRLALARTFLWEPKLILYDEPFTGLDAEGQELLRSLILTQRSSIQLLVSHDPSLLQALKYRELKIFKGRTVGEETS